MNAKSKTFDLSKLELYIKSPVLLQSDTWHLWCVVQSSNQGTRLETGIIVRILKWNVILLESLQPYHFQVVGRSFSLLKVIKLKARNHLLQSSLDQILRVKLESPDKVAEDSLDEILELLKKDRKKTKINQAALLVHVPIAV